MSEPITNPIVLAALERAQKSSSIASSTATSSPFQLPTTSKSSTSVSPYLLATPSTTLILVNSLLKLL